MPPRDLTPLIEALGLDVDRIPVCQACLSFVSFALDDDDGERAARREARKMTPILWDEGLAEPVLDAVLRACERGVAAALDLRDELERGGGRSAAAREIVLHLARQQRRRARIWLRALRN